MLKLENKKIKKFKSQILISKLLTSTIAKL